MKLKTGIRAGNKTGLGDCVAKIAEALGLDRAAHGYGQATGNSCGCARRREMPNHPVPELI